LPADERAAVVRALAEILIKFQINEVIARPIAEFEVSKDEEP
jgi:hypothetical protein